MSFFASNLGLTELFNNPQVSRVYNPDAGNQPLSESVLGRSPFEALSNSLSGNTNTTGTSNGGYNTPWVPTDSGSGVNLGGLNFPSLSSTTTDASQPLAGPESVFGDSYSSNWNPDTAYATTAGIEGLSELDRMIYEMQNLPSGVTTLASALVPGFGLLSGLKQYSMGINPLYGTFLGNLFGLEEGSQTTEDYTGGTDYFGNPLTSWQTDFLDAMGGYANTYESDIANMFGWGTDEYFDAIQKTFDEIESGEPLDYNPWDTFNDWTGGLFSDIFDGFGDGTTSDTTTTGGTGYTTVDVGDGSVGVSDPGGSSSDSGSTSSDSGSSYGGDYGSGDSWDSGDYGGYDESWG